ncbi:MAG TPA: methyltransferase [Azospirillaceae bacterium]|nr:methyltransferase [Azospirillaceae bacterium]
MPDPVLMPSLLAVTALLFALFSARVRRGGVTVWAWTAEDPVQGATAAAFRLAGFLILAQAALLGWRPEWEPLLGGVPGYDTRAVRLAALAIGTAGALVMLGSQLWMGRSWRIGVPDRPGELVTGGPFRFSRNPVFLGMGLVLAGVFLWWPTIVSGIAAALWQLSVAIQVRLEERALEGAYGEAYRAYRARVRRWI